LMWIIGYGIVMLVEREAFSSWVGGITNIKKVDRSLMED
jgi:hypothetical protein